MGNQPLLCKNIPFFYRYNYHIVGNVFILKKLPEGRRIECFLECVLGKERLFLRFEIEFFDAIQNRFIADFQNLGGLFSIPMGLSQGVKDCLTLCFRNIVLTEFL